MCLRKGHCVCRLDSIHSGHQYLFFKFAYDSRNERRQKKGFIPVRLTLLILFLLSGLAGLIYESIWSHYLKLFLGHAAYAQTLVLCVFMGGLAIGAWIASRYSPRWRNSLRAYAVAEFLIGGIAIVSHALYERVTGWVFDQILPTLDSPLIVQAMKWSVGIALLLPQSILLGVTFPLMSAAFLRRFQHTPGVSIGMLYFTNSLGGAAGVLLSGFILIEFVGLPGTLLAGGLISAAVGIVAWLVSAAPQWRASAIEPRAASASIVLPMPAAIFLTTSLLTGAASFTYEIGWIRMLSLVLGATTHSFELMLSAFILGLALGGWWIRQRIDRLADPVKTLVRVQLAMGLFAVLTIPLYGNAFDAMASLLSVLSRDDAGYDIFLLVSHGIALVIMLPATICAGMTLPLITHILVAGGQGERSVGRVYAINTVGAIIGVLAAVHLLMPAIGLKSLIVAGGLIDVATGLALALLLLKGGRYRPELVAGAVCACAVVVVALAAGLDPRRISSGVFRTGVAWLPDDHRVLFQHDGKTATVSVLGTELDVVAVLTNGKSDGSIHMGDKDWHTPDEPTQILIGALPIAIHPRIETAAVVGLGTGMTSRVVLDSSRLQRLDTVEIEAGIIRAAEYFRPMVSKVFDDSRSRIHVEDAKTFFSSRGHQYDLIISQPSNPWVSGVSSLFTREYYERIRQALRPDGLFVQWMHVYENDVPLVISVLKALKSQFPVFDLYQLNQSNIGIVAFAGDRLPSTYFDGFNHGVAPLLNRVGIYTADDLESLYLGSSDLLGSLIDSYDIPENSDFFPILDLNAPRARFAQRSAAAFFQLASEPMPVMEMLSGRGMPRDVFNISPRLNSTRAEKIRRALALTEFMVSGNHSGAWSAMPASLRSIAPALRSADSVCDNAAKTALWFVNARRLSLDVVPFLPPAQLEPWWRALESHNCAAKLTEYHRQWLILLKAFGHRDTAAVRDLSASLILRDPARSSIFDRIYLLKAVMTARLAQGDAAGAVADWNRFGGPIASLLRTDLVLRLLVSRAVDAPSVLTDRSAARGSTIAGSQPH